MADPVGADRRASLVPLPGAGDALLRSISRKRGCWASLSSVVSATRVALFGGKAPGYKIEKTTLPRAHLRNRTVDLLLTMYRSAVPELQAGRLTCQYPSADRHSQALDKLARAPFSDRKDGVE